MRVVIDQLTVQFEGIVALRPVTLTIPGGRMVAIMGPSGSGKSTLLGAIDGRILPTAGSVTIEYDSGNAQSPDWIFQNSPMLDRRTALDNAALGAIVRGGDVSESFSSAVAALDTLGLKARASLPVYSLSGGERQRVAIARAMVSNSQVLLADEPTASLDASSRGLVVDALRAAAGKGAIVIVATHDDFVASSCDDVFGLDSERDSLRG